MKGAKPETPAMSCVMAYEVHECSTPQLRGELAVTGWGASTWFSGAVTHIAAGKRGADYTIYFRSDKKHIVTKLPAANYGPGSVNEVTQKSKLGWVFLLPTAVAGGEVAPGGGGAGAPARARDAL